MIHFFTWILWVLIHQTETCPKSTHCVSFLRKGICPFFGDVKKYAIISAIMSQAHGPLWPWPVNGPLWASKISFMQENFRAIYTENSLLTSETRKHPSYGRNLMVNFLTTIHIIVTLSSFWPVSFDLDSLEIQDT